MWKPPLRVYPLSGVAREGHDGGMRFILIVAGLVVTGIVAVWILKALLGIVGYLLVGAIVVGGAAFIYGRVRRGLASGRYRRITR